MSEIYKEDLQKKGSFTNYILVTKLYLGRQKYKVI